MRAAGACQANHQRIAHEMLLDCCCGACTNGLWIYGSDWDSCQCHPVLQEDWLTLSYGAKVPRMKTCDKCHGAMLPERAVDLDAGLAITVFACLNCGRRKAADQEPRPITARH
jgi:hypothetical protein